MPITALPNVSAKFVDITVDPLGGGGGSGTVTSVDVSGGTTGLTTTGGPIGGAGTITIQGILGVANGGTGTSSPVAAGYVKSTGAAFTNQTVPIPIADGGTNATVAPTNTAVVTVQAGGYTGDAANLAYDSTNHYVGIGVGAPVSPLDLAAHSGSTNGVTLREGSIGLGSAISWANAAGAASGTTVYGTPSNLNLNAPTITLNGASVTNGTLQMAGASSVLNSGTFSTNFNSLVLNNGLNSTINVGFGTYFRIINPSAPFSLGGFSGPTDGRRIILYSSVPQTMTVVNEDLGSTASSRIKTLTGGNVVLSAGLPSVVELIYDVFDQRWILVDAGINAGFVKQDGSVPLIGNWNAGNFRIDSQNSTRWYNVRAYGAVGDGVTDDTAAIQAALNAIILGSGLGKTAALYLPTGLYKVSSGLTFNPGVSAMCLTIIGDGRQSSVIQASAAFTAGTVLTVGSSTFQVDVKFKDFQITGSSTAISNGTVAVTSGSPNIIGTGTGWLAGFAGKMILINSVPYQVNTVADGTHLALTQNYQGTTVGGLSNIVIANTLVGISLFTGSTSVLESVSLQWMGTGLVCSAVADHFTLLACDFQQCTTGIQGNSSVAGLWLNGFTVHSCYFAFSLQAVSITDPQAVSNVNIRDCEFGVVGTFGFSAITLQTVTNPVISGNHYEQGGLAGAGSNFLAMNTCKGAVVEGNNIGRSASATSLSLISCTSVTDSSFQNNSFQDLNVGDTAINFDSGSKRNTVGSQAFINALTTPFVDSNTSVGLDGNFYPTGLLVNGIAARNWQTNLQTLTTATATLVALDNATPQFNRGTMWSSGANTRLTVPTSGGGTYIITGQVTYVNNVTGNRTCALFKNGARIALTQGTADTGAAAHAQGCSTIDVAVAGDFYEMKAQQDSGGNLNTVPGADLTYLSAVKVQ